MSSSRVRYTKQFIKINSYSYDTTNKVYNITANNHNLFTGVPIYLSSDQYYTSYLTSAVVTSSNTFTANCVDSIQSLTHVYVNGYLSGQTGEKEQQTLPRSTGTDTVIQSYVNGTGGAVYNIQVSLDASHWITTNTITHGTNSGNTTYTTIKSGWAYMRANVTSIGANTNLVLMTGE